MKKKLLHIVTLLFFSVGSIHFMFTSVLTGDISKLLPLKISPQMPTELQRIYMFERIHKSIERGKKGITS